MKKSILFFPVFFIVGHIIFSCDAYGKDSPTGQEKDLKSALAYIGEMKTEIQQAHLKLANVKEGADLGYITITVKSVPNLKRQFQSLSECVRIIQESHRSFPAIQNLSSDLSKIEAIMNELDRVSKQNLKSASQDQLNKLSLAVDTLEQNLPEVKNIVLRSGAENLKKSLRGDIEDMREEVNDALKRLSKAQEGDNLDEICITTKNLPNFKKQYESLSEKVEAAKKNYGSSQEIKNLSSEISRIGNILEELERVAKANRKADSEVQIKKLSDSLIAVQSKIK